jgi:pimeloyl-ACP methyl ester carboxylesterase
MVTEADIRLADGRTLHAYDTPADGIASSPGAPGSAVSVFWLHGSPNIGSPPEPLFAAAEANGLHWVSYDRPGYGGSGPHDGRTVASAAADVAAIADAFGIGRFAVLGRSGGGPHALACAALLPGRVTRAGVLVSLAPWQAEGLDWFAGMAASNVHEYTTAASEPESLIAELVQTAARIAADPTSHVSKLGPEMPESDLRVVADTGIRALLAKNFAEALRQSASGWIDDALAFCAPWGFNLSDIRVPVLLWHGENDVFSPAAHARWLAGKVPSAELWVLPNTAHFGALEVVPDVLSWLIRPS